MVGHKPFDHFAVTNGVEPFDLCIRGLTKQILADGLVQVVGGGSGPPATLQDACSGLGELVKDRPVQHHVRELQQL